MGLSLSTVTPLLDHECEWCGKPCDGIACSHAHEAMVLARDKDQGAAVVRVLKLWRKHRGRKDTPGQGAMTKAAELTDAFLKSDRQARLARTAQRKAAEAAAAAPPKAPKPPKAAKPSYEQQDLGLIQETPNGA